MKTCDLKQLSTKMITLIEGFVTQHFWWYDSICPKKKRANFDPLIILILRVELVFWQLKHTKPKMMI